MVNGMALLLIGLFYTAAWTFITSGTNDGFNNEIDVLVAPMPDIDDFDTILGTDAFAFGGAWIGAIGAKVAAFFAAMINLFVTPELTLYGQTVDLGAIAVVNMVFIAFMGFGLYSMVSQLIGGIL